MLVGVNYLIIDFINGLFVNMPFYVAAIGFSFIVFWLNRVGKYNTANIIFLTSISLLLYAFGRNDVNRTGIHNYFIVLTAIAFTLNGYEQLRWGFFYFGLMIIFFFAAYFLDTPNIIPIAEYSQRYITTSFITNFIVAIIIMMALFFFLLRINSKSEEQLTAKNELLTKANRELDRFVYSASHDLRAPLSSVLGLIEIAKRSNDPKEINQFLAMMKKRVMDLDLFINEIIDYSRNARQEITRSEFNLWKLVEEVCDGLKYSVGTENISVRYVIPESLVISSDRVRMKVVLNNVIGNAMKYNDSTKAEQRILVTAEKNNNHLKIQIEDNGIGIEPQHLPKVFDMFYRASENSKGSGLGLYIVKETVSTLQGTIEVNSIMGKGSEFVIEIPMLS